MKLSRAAAAPQLYYRAGGPAPAALRDHEVEVAAPAAGGGSNNTRGAPNARVVVQRTCRTRVLRLIYAPTRGTHV